MGNFEEAYAITSKSEGGFANDPKDRGGMTVFGLTRRDWPNWGGWHVVDDLIAKYGEAKAISLINGNQQLKDSSKALFKANYWTPLQLDAVKDNQVADMAYDTAINMGVGTSAKFMQQVAGVTVDLHVGPNTIAAVNAMNGEQFYNEFVARRKARFDAIIAANPTQAKFKKSWYSRLIPYRK